MAALSGRSVAPNPNCNIPILSRALTRREIMPQLAASLWRMDMARAARSPDAEATSADEIIGMLDDLGSVDLGRVAEAAQTLRLAKQQAEREAFIARVRAEAAAIGLVPEQLFAPVPGAPRKQASSAPRKRGRGVVAPQYRSPDGADWSGRGKPPRWLVEQERQGRNRDEFRIKEGQADLIETAKREHEASD